MRNYYKELQDIKELPEKGTVLDLGCRDAKDSIPFNEAGWKNVIVDKDCNALSQAVSNLKKDCESYCEDMNIFLKSRTDQFDIIIANSVLPFFRTEYKDALKNIYLKLKKDGIFIGSFFGERDDWGKKRPEMFFHSRKQAFLDLSDYKLLNFQEIDKIGSTHSGPLKKWHIFRFIGKKI